MPIPNKHNSKHAEVIDVDALDEDSIQPNHPTNPQPTPPSDLELAELLKPSINIQSQFNHYNKKHFSNQIINTTVEYSTRMTLCAGTCTFRPPNIRIALSEPLLKFRPRSDLLSTLLHEMIHAYLFLTEGLSRDGPDGHGPKFMFHAHRINGAEQAVNITSYHEFRAEVDHYRVHHWRCEKCSNLIKRAMNRAPGPTDQYWEIHQRNCGGKYVKIAGPPKKEKPVKPPKNRAIAVGEKQPEHMPKGIMKTFRIDHMLSGCVPKPAMKMVNCPVCDTSIRHDEMNKHLDSCLAEGMFTQAQETPKPQSPPPADYPPVPEREVSRDQFKRTTKSFIEPKPIVLSDDDRCPVPDNSSKDANPQTDLGPVKSHALGTSQKNYDVMQFIADPHALYKLALAPNEFPPEQVDSLFRDLPPYIQIPNQPDTDNGIEDFLQSLIHPESALSRERYAKARINPLKLGPKGEEFSFQAVSKRLSISWAHLREIINSSTDEDGNIVLSARLLDKLYPSEPQSTHYGKSTRTSKRPRGRTFSVEESVKDRPHTQKRGSAAVIPEIRDEYHAVTAARGCSKRRGSKKRALGDRHTSGLEVYAPPSLTFQIQGDGTENSKPTDEPDRAEASRTAPSRRELEPSVTTPAKSHRCPICDIVLSRQDLEAHVATCMMSTGLADAF